MGVGVCVCVCEGSIVDMYIKIIDIRTMTNYI